MPEGGVAVFGGTAGFSCKQSSFSAGGADGDWEEYPSCFVENPSIFLEQPDSFERECWRDGGCLITGATMLEKDGKTLLRFIINTDEPEQKKCIDVSYCENGWLIEDVQVVENFYRDGYCCSMMENSYDHKKPGQTD